MTFQINAWHTDLLQKKTLYFVREWPLLQVVQHTEIPLTECVHTRQKVSEMGKSWILMTLGWVDILMGGVDHAKYF